MKCLIFDWYGTKLVPDAIEAPTEVQEQFPARKIFEVEIEIIEDLLKLAKQHGNIMLSPPNKGPLKGHWSIAISDNEFRQRG
jgi:hypothetical protein